MELDTELPVAFCPYCGHQSLIESDTLGKVLTEKERTKRVLTLEKQKAKRESRKNTLSILELIIENFQKIAIGIVFVVIWGFIIFEASCS